MMIVMRLFDSMAARAPTARQQGGNNARKDETMPNANASLSSSRQRYVTGAMLFQAVVLCADRLACY
jgi:hypothetical protein